MRDYSALTREEARQLAGVKARSLLSAIEGGSAPGAYDPRDMPFLRALCEEIAGLMDVAVKK